MVGNRAMRTTTMWLLALACLCHCATATKVGSNFLVESKGAAGQRVRLHELSASEYERIARLMNRAPAIAQARLISSVPATRTLTTSSDDSSSGFFSSPSFMNLLRIIRFNTTDNSKTNAGATPLCVIKVSDKEVMGQRRAADDSNVKCVVVVKDKNAQVTDGNGAANAWDSANWGGGHNPWYGFQSGAGWNQPNWGDDRTDDNDDKFDGDVDFRPIYTPVYRPFFVPQPYPHGHHSHSHERKVPASSKRKASTADTLQQYQIDQYVRKALRDYNAQKAQSDDGGSETETETMQVPPNLQTQTQFGPFSPYGIYGSLYNPALRPNLFPSAARKPTLKTAPNFNYPSMPSYLHNPFETVNVEERSNKHFAITAVDEEDNNHDNNDYHSDDDDDNGDGDDGDDDEVEADDY